MKYLLFHGTIMVPIEKTSLYHNGETTMSKEFYAPKLRTTCVPLTPHSDQIFCVVQEYTEELSTLSTSLNLIKE